MLQATINILFTCICILQQQGGDQLNQKGDEENNVKCGNGKERQKVKQRIQKIEMRKGIDNVKEERKGKGREKNVR